MRYILAALLAFITIASTDARHQGRAHPIHVASAPSCSALGYPTGVCSASWNAVSVWTLQNDIGTGIGAPSGTVFTHPNYAWFQASISGTTLTVNSTSCPYTSQQLAIGYYIYGHNIPDGTYITGGGTDGVAQCGGGSSGGQNNSTWTLNQSATISSEMMGAGPDHMPTASANCGMPQVSKYGYYLFGGPGASGCTLTGWDFRGSTLEWYISASPGTNNPLTIQNSLIDFSGNASNPSGSTYINAIATTGINNVTFQNNTLDLSSSNGNQNSFGTVFNGTENTTVSISNNYVKNAPANGLNATGYATWTNNFIDRNGCSNGAHPDMSTWYGFGNYTTGSFTTVGTQSGTSININSGTPVTGQWMEGSGTFLMRDSVTNAPLTITGFSGGVMTVSGSGATFGAGTYYMFNPVLGSNSINNYTYQGNLFNYAMCGTATAVNSWTTGATSVTISGFTALDATRYAPGADMFLIDYTTEQMIGQITSINTSTGVVTLAHTITGNSAYTNYAAAAGTAGDMVLIAGGQVSTSGWSAGATTVAVDACVGNYQTSPNPGGPIWTVVSGTTQVVNEHATSEGCSNSTTVASLSMPNTRATGTVMMNFVNEVAAMRPLINSPSGAQLSLTQNNIVYNGDNTNFWNNVQFTPGIQGNASAQNVGGVVQHNLWSNTTFCAPGSSGVTGTPVVGTQSDNLLVQTGGSTNPC